MKVVAFYSFKGGVGRTMSMLSTAYTLARLGRKVVVADWDLQAPGLSLMKCMHAADQGPAERGVLEYLLSWQPTSPQRGKVSIEEMLVAPRIIDAARNREVEDEFAMRGDMQFISAGNLRGGVDEFLRAVNELENLNLTEFLVDYDKDPRMIFKVFRIQVEKAQYAWQGENQQGAPDYLLLDCRTGITEIGDLLLGDATDFNVIVYGQDEQNLEGLRIVLNASKRLPGDLVANTMLIWSGSVPGHEEMKAEQRKHKRQVMEDVCRFDSLGMREPWPKEFQSPFNPDLVLSNVPLVHRVPDSDFAKLFREITDYVEERCLWRDKLIEAGLTQPGQTEQEKAVRLATAKPWDKEAAADSRQLCLSLSKGLEQLLFNPPRWNLAGVDTTPLVRSWPEEFKVEQQHQLWNLLAYSSSFSAAQKRRILESGDPLNSRLLFQFREVLLTVSRERKTQVARPAYDWWSILLLTVRHGMEWLGEVLRWNNENRTTDASLPEESAKQLETMLESLLSGRPVSTVPESGDPLWSLLVADAFREWQGKIPDSLVDWLPRGVPLIDERVNLLGAVMERIESQPDNVKASVWHEHADALQSRARERENDKAGAFDRAIDSYRQALKFRPDDAAMLHNLGASLDNRGQAAAEGEKAEWFDQAIETYRQALKIGPDHADTLYNLGISLSHRGELTAGAEKAEWFDQAIDSYWKALKVKPYDADVLQNLGISLSHRGKLAAEGEKAEWFDQAIDSYRQALKIRPDDTATRGGLIGTLSRLSYVKAESADKLLAEAREVLADDGHRPEFSYNYCCLLARAGDVDACLDELSAMLKHSPERIEDVATDMDFANVADSPRFRELISPLVWNPRSPVDW